MKNNLMLIAGPCSAENEEQLFETAKQLKMLVNPDYFRAGLWKPRTNPNSFEGMGESGISTLKKIEKEIKLKIITEVASIKHLELILKNDFSAFWIGARTVSNTIFIKEVLEILKDNDKNINIFIKNPFFPDLELWAGIIERFLNADFKNIIAIHRGFFPYQKTKYRNVPLWEIPTELRIRFPNLKILCDPSHIAGDTKYLKEIAQEALNYHFDGLMFEAHYSPEIAQSDKNQQITPKQLKIMLDSLEYKSNFTKDEDFEIQLNNLREKIDIIDYKLLDLLAERYTHTDKIGELKKQHNVSPFQKERWKQVLDTRLKYAEKTTLSQNVVRKIMNIIHEESVTRQI